MTAIRIVAAVIRDGRGRMVLVRKRGTTAFMQPGGKIEAGEDEVMALARELREELGCALVATSARLVGRVEAPAANEPGQIVAASVYEVEVTGAIAARAEIEELVWIDPAAPGAIPLAPLTRDHVLPRG